MSNTKNDYPYITAWGRMMHSNHDYVWNERQKARAAGAPQNAVYYNIDEKRWVTFDEVTNVVTRHTIENMIGASA